MAYPLLSCNLHYRLITSIEICWLHHSQRIPLLGSQVGGVSGVFMWLSNHLVIENFWEDPDVLGMKCLRHFRLLIAGQGLFLVRNSYDSLIHYWPHVISRIFLAPSGRLLTTHLAGSHCVFCQKFSQVVQHVSAVFFISRGMLCGRVRVLKVYWSLLIQREPYMPLR